MKKIILFFTLLLSFKSTYALNSCSASHTIEIHKAMQVWQGHRDSHYMTYVGWEQRYISGFFQTLTENWSQLPLTPIITWAPHTAPNGTIYLDIVIQITNGIYDSYVKNFISALSTFLKGPDGKFDTADDRSAVIRLAHEMNGDWYVWSPAYPQSPITASNYASMFQHVRSLFISEGLSSSRVPFFFCPARKDDGKYAMEEYFPGNSHVDWIGMDGYNNGINNWLTPTEVYGNMLGRLRQLSPTKPLVIGEFGTGSKAGNKSQWIISTFNYFKQFDVSICCYFNIDIGVDEWAIFGGVSGDSHFSYGGVNYQTWEGYAVAVRNLTLSM